MIASHWFESKSKLRKERDGLLTERDRLLNLIADPKLLGVAVDERGVEIQLQPREEIMRHLFVMLSHAMGDTPNFVECAFGPDPKTGKTYVVTLKHYHGKTPGQVHDEKVAELNQEIERLSRQLREPKA